MGAYDDEMKLPHQFQIKSRIPQDTKLLTPDGKKIFLAAEPIGFVAPKGYSKYVVEN